MPDYNNGKIYIIYPNCEYDEGDVYYGSTTQILSKRMSTHRCQNFIKSLADKYGLENLKIELVCEYKCETKEQLNREEGKYIRENKCINKVVAGRTKKEWREDHKEQIKQNRENYKDKAKQWVIEHKEQLTEYKKQYYVKHKEKVSKNKSEKKIECLICKSVVRLDSLPRHQKSKKCLSEKSK